MPLASIDIGSNSVLLLIISDEGETLTDIAIVTKLGQGLGEKGLLNQEAKTRTQDAIKKMVDIAVSKGISPSDIRAVGTSALRRALNANSFLQTIKETTSVNIKIINGEEEATLTAKGAITGLKFPQGPILVVDVGGGSTELTTIRINPNLPDSCQILNTKSLELGTVRLTESFLDSGSIVKPEMLHDAREFIRKRLSTWNQIKGLRSLVGVGGSPTTLMSATMEQKQYFAEDVHGSVLELFAVRVWLDRLLLKTSQERALMIPQSPDRADTIFAGALILEQLLVLTNRPGMVVSSRGLRFALL